MSHTKVVQLRELSWLHTEIEKQLRCGYEFAEIQDTKPCEVCEQKRFFLKMFW